MHDGVPSHFSQIVRDTLGNKSHEIWTRKGGPVPKSARTPGHNSLDFYLRGNLK